ncbi:MAG: CBS domain-containing protein [Hyphomicrobiaceae bacterium]
MRLIDIVERKGHDIAMVPDTATVGDVARMMSEQNCGSVIVRTKAGNLIGLVNEKRIVETVATSDKLADAISVKDVMVSPVPAADAGTSMIDGFKAMTNGRFRHLVVTDDGRSIGVVSIGDLVKCYVHDIELENSVLRDLAAAHIVSADRESA